MNIADEGVVKTPHVEAVDGIHKRHQRVASRHEIAD
jgi:hypothetical protein